MMGMHQGRKAAALAATCALVGVQAIPQAAARPTTPESPQSAAVAEMWVNPQVRPTSGRVSVDVDALQIAGNEVQFMSPGQMGSLTLTVHNHSAQRISGVTVTVGRADAVGTVADGRAAVAADDDQYSVFSAAMPVAQQIAADSSTQVSVPVDLNALDITAPGVYPIIVMVSAETELAADGDGSAAGATASAVALGSLKDSERFLLPVRTPLSANTNPNDSIIGNNTDGGLFAGNADSASGMNDAVAESLQADDADASLTAPTRMTVLWPITATTNITPGATGEAPNRAPLVLQDESLAEQLAEGGRLDVLLSAYEEAVADPRIGTAACLALDPALLDTVERMTNGYTVSDTRTSPVAEKQRLRDSWGSNKDGASGAVGRGEEDAKRWLARVSAAARSGCSVALPWANADVNALARTGSQWLVREGLANGAETIRRTTGAQPIRDVVIPGSGFLDEVAVSAATLVTTGDVAAAWEAADMHNAGTHDADEPNGNTPNGNTPNGITPNGISSLEQQQTPPGIAPAGVTPTGMVPNGMAPTDGTVPQTTVLLADNTVWGTPHDSHTAVLSSGDATVMATLYPSSLAATLAQLGENPATMAYSNPTTRFDYRRDSEFSRRLDAAAALELAAKNRPDEDLIVLPPTTLSARADADTIFSSIRELLDRGVAVPQPAGAAIIPTPERRANLIEPVDPGTESRMGSPFADPMTVSDLEIQRGAQQASYTDDVAHLMVNDERIALTPYLFVEPLLRDVVRAFSLQGRHSLSTYQQATAHADNILNANRDMLQTLRSSVTLLPPGNVFTRTSDASPLPMVARNGLPLPVVAELRYSAPAGVVIGVPSEQLIPAKGNVTVMLPTEVPPSDERVDVHMWLATREGAAISHPVELSVQTRSAMVRKGAAATAVATLALLVVGARFFVKRRRAAQRSTDQG